MIAAILYIILHSGTQKTLCETLTVADAILFHVVGQRVDNELPRHGLGLLSLNPGLAVMAWLQRRQDEPKTDPST